MTEIEQLQGQYQAMRAAIASMTDNIMSEIDSHKEDFAASINRVLEEQQKGFEEINERLMAVETLVQGHNNDIKVIRDWCVKIEKTNGEQKSDIAMTLKQQTMEIDVALQSAKTHSTNLQQLYEKKLVTIESRLTQYARSLEQQIAGKISYSDSMMIFILMC
jgi:hypothetical protein